MKDHSPRTVFERVITLLKDGDQQQAETLCRDALERDAGDINFVSLLGSILARRGDLQEAAELESGHACTWHVCKI